MHNPLKPEPVADMGLKLTWSPFDKLSSPFSVDLGELSGSSCCALPPTVSLPYFHQAQVMYRLELEIEMGRWSPKEKQALDLLHIARNTF